MRLITVHTDHAYMYLQLAKVKLDLLLTSIYSEHAAWLDMHSSYTNRGGVAKMLLINTPSSTQLGPSKSLCCLLRSVSSHFTTSTCARK